MNIRIYKTACLVISTKEKSAEGAQPTLWYFILTNFMKDVVKPSADLTRGGFEMTIRVISLFEKSFTKTSLAGITNNK